MSFLSPTPSVPQSEPENGIGSAAKASAEIERQLSERVAAPDIKPVLTAIAGTANQLMRQPRVAKDAEIQHVLRLMALAGASFLSILTEALPAGLLPQMGRGLAVSDMHNCFRTSQ